MVINSFQEVKRKHLLKCWGETKKRGEYKSEPDRQLIPIRHAELVSASQTNKPK
jgi:hypothetical protein